MENPKTIKIDNKLINKVKSAIDVALEYEAATSGKRKLGITGEVGEVLVCHKLGLKLVLDSRSEGFDALDKNGLRVQIKTRRSELKDYPRIQVGRVVFLNMNLTMRFLRYLTININSARFGVLITLN